ncbi:melanophilin [Synchiropus splendidus]|uniref:melanophilin n=1 Tax=Synchiropus splendidus TaxID=270530 RepID=UPI00237ED167|nr:melanophilin [Synchiropus splendidus]XP_053733252.1 melanophilin [Synchiropus splendidus]XP_053733253.1 melanophilin [Synchiropus splendidus]XP_053733254.1 melanophilin [Synchiropus splendidus]
MPGATPGPKLDLSKLTDDEAKHVWEVVQRDFDLRKKEEDRLGELKTRIEKEDTKRELLGNQSSLSETHCIRCLQPFKFLLSSKRQCLDCQLLVCKSCTRYNKKEQGWVCDPCHMARVLKIGTLEWYHANVRSRFKRFGSAKVMRSLFKRLSGGSSCSQDDLVELQEYDVQSIAEIHSGYEESSVEVAESPRCTGKKKIKRRLTVDPFDFDLDGDYSIGPRAHPSQLLEEQRKSLNFSTDVGVELGLTPQDDTTYLENRTVASRSISQLSYSSCGSGSVSGLRGGYSSFIPGTDDTEEDEDDLGQLYPSYQSHSSFWNQESRTSPVQTVQITELDRRMSAIETFLNRLEQKMNPIYDQTKTPHSESPLPQWEDVDLEEQQLRQKLHQLTDNISDHSLSSDEDEDVFIRSVSSQDVPSVRSPEGDVHSDRIFSRPESRASIVVSRLDDCQKSSRSTDSLDKHLPLEEGAKNSFRGSTALLVQLGDKIAQAAADVQNTQSQVSLIESRIAALNAAGMQVDRMRRSATKVQTRRVSPSFPTRNQSNTDFYYGSRHEGVQPNDSGPNLIRFDGG